MDNIEVFGLKCMNCNHAEDTESRFGKRITNRRDRFVMNAKHNESNNIVSLACYWCGYEAEVDLTIKGFEVERFNGSMMSFKQ